MVEEAPCYTMGGEGGMLLLIVLGLSHCIKWPCHQFVAINEPYPLSQDKAISTEPLLGVFSEFLQIATANDCARIAVPEHVSQDPAVDRTQFPFALSGKTVTE